jgi:phosphatidyl-myo-inositol dimannoside synthase
MFARVSQVSSSTQVSVRRCPHGGEPAAAQRPRLLVLTPDFPPAHGGIQVLTHRVSAGLRGFEVRVLALDCSGANTFDSSQENLSIRRIGGAHLPVRARMVTLNAAALIEARRFRPDVTLSAHLLLSPAAALIRRTLGIRTVQYFHANEIGRKARLASFAARQADVAIAVSAYTASLVQSTGATPADLRIIPPGVDLPQKREPRAHGKPTLLTIARLKDTYKGHDVMIRALALVREQIPEVQWIVIGDGPLRPSLEALARAHGVDDAIRFLGSVSDEERDHWLADASVFAMPSRLPGGGLAGEGFGIVYLEAAAYGKPVLAGRVAGAVDAVIDGQTGLLIDPTDHLAVAGAISTLLLDRQLARRLGDAGVEHARGLAWPEICGRVEEVLLEQVGASK